MLDKRQRYFKQFRFAITTRTHGVEPLPLIPSNPSTSSLLDCLKGRCADGKAFNRQDNGDLIEMISIKHFEAKNLIAMLFHRESPNAADPSYRKKKDGKIIARQATKYEGEQQAVSAHMLISTRPHGKWHNAVIEEIPGISLTVAQRILREALAQYIVPYHIGSKTKDVRFYLHFDAKASEDIIKILQNSSINSMNISKLSPSGTIDSDSPWEPVYDKIVLKPKKEFSKIKALEKLPDAIKWARSVDYNEIRIEYQDEDGKPRSVKIDRTSEKLEAIFTQKAEIYFDHDLDPCCTAIDEKLIEEVQKTIEFI